MSLADRGYVKVATPCYFIKSDHSAVKGAVCKVILLIGHNCQLHVSSHVSSPMKFLDYNKVHHEALASR